MGRHITARTSLGKATPEEAVAAAAKEAREILAKAAVKEQPSKR